MVVLLSWFAVHIFLGYVSLGLQFCSKTYFNVRIPDIFPDFMKMSFAVELTSENSAIVNKVSSVRMVEFCDGWDTLKEFKMHTSDYN